jgi:hypothetical protein
MELSTADILFFLSLAAAVVLALLAPGWVALGWAFAHRHRARTGQGGFWAFAGGAVTGVAVSIGAAAATLRLADAVGGAGVLPLSVLLSWVACWLVAFGVGRTPARVAQEGWGR